MARGEDSSIIAGKKKSIFTPQAACAVVMIVGFTVMFNRFVHSLHDDWVMHPAMVLLLPPLTIAWLASVVPLMMFISFQDDYKNVWPLLPSNYGLILKKTFQAMQQHNLKVRAKDL